MLKQTFQNTAVRASKHDGDIAAYTTHLERKGYSSRSIQGYVKALEHFFGWLETKGIPLADVGRGHVDLFLYKHLSRCRCITPAPTCLNTVRAAVKQWLVVASVNLNNSAANNTRSKQFEEAIQAYDRFLEELAGLRHSTRQRRRRIVKELLTAVFKGRRFDLSMLTPAALVTYVTRRAQGLRPSSVRAITLALRSYLKFLRFTGERRAAPPEAIPKTPFWSHASLPATFHEQQIQQLLATFDRTRASGIRDYAMARCLIDLGLRTCEVANLTLDDIDWRQGTITITRDKSRRTHLLPLPTTAGAAIANYVYKGRPRTQARALFVHHRAPLGQGVAPSTVRAAIRQAFRRANLAPARVHMLRHTAATRMLREGASLKNIADVLGHRCLDSTVIYTKVDIEELAEVAMPWPGRAA